ncbi:MAG: GMP synthase [Sphingobacteriales bacterium UTBCD1]|jgi:GMP synthase-like glutamine amidotransferase|nr:MAG: GMP synthase [Sphingobacteriales bacterium UTBCD1]
MNWNEMRQIRIAILDLNAGHVNQGMRCIREIIQNWAHGNELNIYKDEFDVRQKKELPDTSYDIYISSGGPGSPLESRYEDWDIAWCRWIDSLQRWNKNPNNLQKKHVLFICHSFQLASRYFNTGVVCKRRSEAFGVFPVHMLDAGKKEPVLEGLKDPFYAVDSREYQVVQPNYEVLRSLGGKVLCIEKERPHVPYERAMMGVRFNEYMIGTQFHPEADAVGMSIRLQSEEKKQSVIKNYGEDKWHNMLHQLKDPGKIMWTYAHVLPNFLNKAVGHFHAEPVL